MKRSNYFVQFCQRCVLTLLTLFCASGMWAASTGPLCFTAQSAGTKISFNVYNGPLKSTPSLEYSTDNENWSNYILGNEITISSAGGKVYFKAGKTDGTVTKNSTFSESSASIRFATNDNVEASGNIMSLLDATCMQTTVPAYAFDHLFYNCANLTAAPEMPAMTLAQCCYLSMYEGCTGLTSAPTLPATTMASQCYESMFASCSSLTSTPALPATTLANECYSYMFWGCSHLTNVSALPATTLAEKCYLAMFEYCTRLTTAPYLPANTLVNSCYKNMFYGCTYLNKVAVGFNNWESSLTPTTDWLKETASTGTFVCPKDLDVTNITRSESNVPAGWTTKNPDYLCFTAEEDNGYVAFEIEGTLTTTPSLQYSTNKTTWTDYTIGSRIALDKTGDKIYFKAKNTNTTFSAEGGNYIHFVSGKKVAANGNIMSLLDASCEQTSVPERAFHHLFTDCTKLTSAPSLPATQLAADCYNYMFKGCSSLTTAPALPATQLAESCYYYMFQGCTNLKRIHVNFTDWNSDNGSTTNWVKEVASSGTFICPSGLTQTTGENYIPEGWTIANSDYLCFTAQEAGAQVGFDIYGTLTTPPSLQYSTDGIYFDNYTFGAKITLTNTGDKVYFKAASANATFGVKDNYIYFSSTGNVAASGNIMSLLDELCLQTSVPEYAFNHLFEGCTKLTSAPKLPATTLANSCYYCMFSGCENLVAAPALPANTLAKSCYEYMFENCKSLTTAPELHATTLAEYCCHAMFIGCENLEEAPLLPAVKLASHCYEYMFYDCSKLNTVTVRFSDWNNDGSTLRWLGGVANTGTFICPKELPENIDADHIPEGWTITKPQYLRFTAEEDNTMLRFNVEGESSEFSTLPSLQYSFDGVNFKDYSGLEARTVTIADTGDYVYLKATTTNSTFSQDLDNFIYFYSDKNVAASGNIMSLLDASCSQTTVPANAFVNLFKDCKNLTNAPELPATTLNANCYRGMFEGCENLTNAPELPATTLAENCYYGMFKGCAKLDSINVNFTAWNATAYSTTDWVNGVASKGTFICPPGLTQTTGVDNIPVGWTVVAAPMVQLNSKGFATYSHSVTTGIDVATSGIETYTATLNGDKIVLTKQENKYIPAGFGVLLYGGESNANKYVSFKAKVNKEGISSGGDLCATTLEGGTLASKPSGTIWALGNENAFLQYTGSAFVHNRAYFVHTLSTSNAKMTIVFDDDDTATGIDDITTNTQYQTSDTTAYNLAGQRVSANAKGIIIKNGKKFIVK